ncbi:hypothetical protein XELAEV_18029286mg [Xenopus laevis]|uniref:Uncharacterized protein n=1 Tax=Xenopus laevis TaxID=8355 RepID=A0A974CR23_XENLA|nr:hypothetical protein XELAEV_18029286mg [Xenopus laevis]
MAKNEKKLTFEGLCSRDPSTRELALNNIREEVQRNIELQGSMITEINKTGPSMLNQLLVRLLLLSNRCPFPDVRQKTLEILRKVQALFLGVVNKDKLYESCEMEKGMKVN